MQGTVKWFNDSRGFGFIAPSDGSRDLFVHFSEIEGEGEGRKTLNDGDLVEFEKADGERGPSATKVRRVEA